VPLKTPPSLFSEKIAAAFLVLKRHFGPESDVLICTFTARCIFFRPDQKIAGCCAYSKVHLTLRPLHWISSGYFERLHVRTHFVTGIADFSVYIERSGHICAKKQKNLQLLV
jgi:hypothetical protein